MQNGTGPSAGVIRDRGPQRDKRTQVPAPARGSNADLRVFPFGLLCTNFPLKYPKLLVLEWGIGLSSCHRRPRRPNFLCLGHFSWKCPQRELCSKNHILSFRMAHLEKSLT